MHSIISGWTFNHDFRNSHSNSIRYDYHFPVHGIKYLIGGFTVPIVTAPCIIPRMGHGNIIAKASQRLDLIKTDSKSQHDFVTNVDTKAENEIIAIIREHFPDHGILAEESGHSEVASDDGIVWVIDPLDGTKNFIHGIPHCAVSIGIRQNQQLMGAVLYDPFKNELFTAEISSD